MHDELASHRCNYTCPDGAIFSGETREGAKVTRAEWSFGNGGFVHQIFTWYINTPNRPPFWVAPQSSLSYSSTPPSCFWRLGVDGLRLGGTM
jgi:hypothetical protein